MLDTKSPIIIRFADGQRRLYFPPSSDAQREALRRIEARELYAGNRIELWRGLTLDADEVIRVETP